MVQLYGNERRGGMARTYSIEQSLCDSRIRGSLSPIELEALKLHCTARNNLRIAMANGRYLHLDEVDATTLANLMRLRVITVLISHYNLPTEEAIAAYDTALEKAHKRKSVSEE